MSDFVKTFNRRVPYPVRLLLVVFVGILGYGSGQSAVAVASKLNGSGADCTWGRTLLFGFDLLRFDEARAFRGLRVSLVAEDASLDIQQFSTGRRRYWIKRAGTAKNGQQLLTYLLAEQQWMSDTNGSQHVQKGDVVFDCGAHVGTFVDIALRRGASKVVAIEPDPVNLECLRRNFPNEIASGAVVVIPKGVWSSEKIITFFNGGGNSGMGSMVTDRHAGEIHVPVTTLDRIVEELAISHVDFIKMDIEGAEREALRGSSQTLKRDFPTLMLDSYHLPDDMIVLPAIIHEANPLYKTTCGPCEESMTPHVSYFHQ